MSHLSSKLKAIDTSWTLFLDRDGVINKRIVDDYVKLVSEFEFLPGVLGALSQFAQCFGRIVVVTNQQGIGKGLMTEEGLSAIHTYMVQEIGKVGGRVDRVYYCPKLSGENPPCRKPNTGMGEEAKRDFPEINFEKSVMVGDSLSDIEFGHRLGMTTVFIGEAAGDIQCVSLEQFASLLRV